MYNTERVYASFKKPVPKSESVHISDPAPTNKQGKVCIPRSKSLFRPTNRSACMCKARYKSFLRAGASVHYDINIPHYIEITTNIALVKKVSPFRNTFPYITVPQ